MKYIALLRGVNVGGKNSVNMRDLKSALTDAGFEHVSTYINSGNVLFESEETDKNLLIERITIAMEAGFGYSVGIALLTAAELQQALAEAPPWWDADAGEKHNAFFIIPPATTHQVAESAGAHQPEYEKLFVHQHLIFWSAPLKTFSRTRWSKVVSSADYQNITVRNANTTKKLLQLSLS